MKDKKSTQIIGILSFSHFKMPNYGGALQGFALKTVINNLNLGNADNICFLPSPFYRSYIHKLLSKTYHFINKFFFADKKRITRTKKFYTTYMFSSMVNQNIADFINNTYDKLIIGSDQVLNPYINNFENLYLGENIDIDKYYYAASFGLKEIPCNWEIEILKHWTKIKMFSFREQTGQIIANKLGYSSRVDLDPTLLLDKDQWLTYLKKIDLKLPNKYIICYIMPGNKEVTRKIKKTARKISKLTDWKIIYCGEKDYMRYFQPSKSRTDFGPLEWLKAMNDSEFVITNSFHGTAFSVNFQKPFFVFTNDYQNCSTSNFSSRIYDFLKDLNLSNRINIDIDSLKNDDITKINFINSQKILSKKRNESIEYIKEILCD